MAGLDFYGAPAVLVSVVLIIGWILGPGLTGLQTPFYFAILLTPILLLVITGLAPRPFAVWLSAVMHQLKRTHTRAVNKRPFNYHEIRKGLFLGRQFRGEEDLRALQRKEGITAIVTLNEEWELFLDSKTVNRLLGSSNEQKEELKMKTGPSQKEVVTSLGGDWTSHRIRFATPDYQAPTQPQLKACVQFIMKHMSNGGKVYVHCNAGKGRSSVVVAAYIMATELKWSNFGDVIKDMRKIRSDVSFGLLDWPFRGQSRAVSTFYDQVITTRIGLEGSKETMIR